MLELPALSLSQTLFLLGLYFFKNYFSIGPLHEFEYAIPLIKRNLALTFLPNNSPVCFLIRLPKCYPPPLFFAIL